MDVKICSYDWRIQCGEEQGRRNLTADELQRKVQQLERGLPRHVVASWADFHVHAHFTLPVDCSLFT
jgi:hypothetical protein